MKKRSQELLAGVAILIAFWLIWSRLRIHVWVQLSGWQLLALFAVLAGAIFLVLDHILNRTRGE
jgi:hypothetical protein